MPPHELVNRMVSGLGEGGCAAEVCSVTVAV